MQAPTVAEDTPKKVFEGFDQDVFSQQHEDAAHTSAEEVPTSLPDKAAPVSSEQPHPASNKAFGSPSEMRSSAHAAKV